MYLYRIKGKQNQTLLKAEIKAHFFYSKIINLIKAQPDRADSKQTEIQTEKKIDLGLWVNWNRTKTLCYNINPSRIISPSPPSLSRHTPFTSSRPNSRQQRQRFMASDSKNLKVEELLKEVQIDSSPSTTKIVDDFLSSIKHAIDKIPEDSEVYPSFSLFFYSITKDLNLNLNISDTIRPS